MTIEPGWRIGLGLLGVFFMATALTGLRKVRAARCVDGTPCSSEEGALERAGRPANPPSQPTVFSRQERSLIYIASYPMHQPTEPSRSAGAFIRDFFIKSLA